MGAVLFTWCPEFDRGSKMKMNPISWIAFVLLLVGGLNWGLVGFFQFDLVAAIFGGMDAALARIVYAVVGLCAVWMAIAAITSCTKAAHGHHGTQTA